MSPRNLILASNPRSGRGRGAKIARRASEFLSAQGHRVTHLFAGGDLELRALLRDAAQPGVDAIVLVGGDGLVHAGINALEHQPEIPVGIIPAGTGNDVAMALGIPLRVEEALQALSRSLAGPTRQIDLARCTHACQQARFAAVYSAGFDAVVNERANRMAFPKGPSRYTVALLAELATMKPRSYRLDVDGVESTREALLIAVANGPSFGGGMQVVPEASMTDGLVDVFIVGPVSKTEFLRIYPKVFSGRHVSHPAVTIIPGRKVNIESDGIVGYADGERQAALPVTIDVLPKALTVLA